MPDDRHGTATRQDGRAAWQHLYGRRWRKVSAAHKRANPLCSMCQAEGRVTAAEVTDHITPHKGDEALFWDAGNIQSLCKQHHDGQKQSIERNGQGRVTIGLDGWPDREVKRFGYSIPHGIEHSGIPLVIVCGPPASGKSTYINQIAAPGDIVVDLDRYLKSAGHKKWTTDKAALQQAFQTRNAHLRSLSMHTTGRAWAIVTAPTAKERATWLEAMGPKASCIVMEVSAEECKRRASMDKDRSHAIERMYRVIDEWWRAYTPG